MKWIILSALLVALVGVSFIKRSTNNVCKTFADYYSDRDKNENCYYNADFDLPIPQIIQRHGYPVETHSVITKDRYILTLFRIPHGRSDANKKPRKPVLLLHGLGANGASYLAIGKKSLGFILADAGYDVWVGNFRGTSYSPNHTSLNNSDIRYWDFSFHEHGLYDVPAQLDLITKLTKQKITYIGHSMGTTSMYVYGTTYPDEAFEKVDMFIALAPAVFVENLETPIKYGFPIWNIIKPLVNVLHNGYTHSGPRLPQWLYDFICFPYPFQMKLCTLHNHILSGFNSAQEDPETYPVTMKRILDYHSIKAMDHYVQLIGSGKFRNYDYGTETNKKVYGCAEPPEYDLSKLKIPNYLIRSDNDLMVHKDDVKRLYDTLPDAVKKPHEIYVVKDKNFNHINFLVAKDIVPLLYDHIVDFLKKQ